LESGEKPPSNPATSNGGMDGKVVHDPGARPACRTDRRIPNPSSAESGDQAALPSNNPHVHPPFGQRSREDGGWKITASAHRRGEPPPQELTDLRCLGWRGASQGKPRHRREAAQGWCRFKNLRRCSAPPGDGSGWPRRDTWIVFPKGHDRP
jgi:hypothetical protein